MPLISLRIGTNPGSLVTLGKTAQSYQVDRANRTKNKTTWSGGRNFSILGQNKRVHNIGFENVPHSVFLQFNNYANVSRLWWLEIPGFGTTKLFEGFGYAQTVNVDIMRVTDTNAFYKFNFVFFEL